MCLFTKDKEGQVSDKPVVCYKYYIRRPGCLRSPYARVEYKIKPGDEVVAEGKAIFKKRPGDPVDYYSVSEGVIHGCRQVKNLYYCLFWRYDGKLFKMLRRVCDSDNFDSLDRKMDKYLEEISGKYALCEMEIPAGERYWIGKDGDVCARRMVYKRDVELTREMMAERAVNQVTWFAGRTGLKEKIIAHYMKGGENKE